MRVLFAALALALLAATVAACGGSDGTATSEADAEAAWETVIADLGLAPDQTLLDLAAKGAAPELEVTIAVPADGQALTFSDGLYGVIVYTERDGAWERVDTADVRTEIAPLLGPGQSATVTIPVDEAPLYRILVPVAGKAVWTDLTE